MISFHVNDMTCAHCVNTLTKAVKAADRDATVAIDLAARRVEIETAAFDSAELTRIIKDAGYTPAALETVAVPAALIPAARRGACCCK